MSTRDLPDAGRLGPGSEQRPVPATADGLRKENLSRVVALVHRHGAVSRSRVTHLTGLSRTAVGALLGELVERGVLVQRDPSPAERAGRPSANYAPHPGLVGVALNADVRGVRIGFSQLDGTVRDSQLVAYPSRPTAPAAAEMVAAVIAERRTAHPEERVVGLGAAIPGRVDSTSRIVTWAPHLGWRQEPFADLLEAATGVPAHLGFDADLAVATETMWGAARGSRNNVYVYGGPGGIGAATIAGDSLLAGGHGLASRVGHFIVDPEGEACSCGRRGCLEPSVSFRNYEAALGEELQGFADLSATLRATRKPQATRQLDRDAMLVGRALQEVVLAYDPEVIVLGGFLGAILEQRRPELEAAILEATVPFVARPPQLQTAQFGADLLLVGAGALAFRTVLVDPTIVPFPATEPTA